MQIVLILVTLFLVSLVYFILAPALIGLCYDRSKSENVEKITKEKDLKRKKFVPIDREEVPLILKEPYDFENLPPPPEEILCNNYDAIESSEVIEIKRKVHFSSMVHILDEVGTEFSSFFDKEI